MCISTAAPRDHALPKTIGWLLLRVGAPGVAQGGGGGSRRLSSRSAARDGDGSRRVHCLRF